MKILWLLISRLYNFSDLHLIHPLTSKLISNKVFITSLRKTIITISESLHYLKALTDIRDSVAESTCQKLQAELSFGEKDLSPKKGKEESSPCRGGRRWLQALRAWLLTVEGVLALEPAEGKTRLVFDGELKLLSLETANAGERQLLGGRVEFGERTHILQILRSRNFQEAFGGGLSAERVLEGSFNELATRGVSVRALRLGCSGCEGIMVEFEGQALELLEGEEQPSRSDEAREILKNSKPNCKLRPSRLTKLCRGSTYTIGENESKSFNDALGLGYPLREKLTLEIVDWEGDLKENRLSLLEKQESSLGVSQNSLIRLLPHRNSFEFLARKLSDLKSNNNISGNYVGSQVMEFLPEEFQSEQSLHIRSKSAYQLHAKAKQKHFVASMTTESAKEIFARLKGAPEHFKAMLSDWNFNAFEHPSADIHALILAIFEPWLPALNVSPETLLRVSLRLEQYYERNRNPFHCFAHGVTVLHSANILIDRGIFSELSPLMRAAVLLAALGHDTDHPGVNNAFEIATFSKLARLYNDFSPLENHHSAKLFKVLNDPELGFWRNIQREDYSAMREFMIELILATDMKKHFALMQEAEVSIKAGNKKTTLFAQLTLHAADLCGSTKTQKVAEMWSRRCSQEFSNQYHLEQHYQVPPTPHFKDLEVPLNFYRGEANFLVFIVKPLFDMMSLLCQDQKLNAPLSLSAEALSTSICTPKGQTLFGDRIIATCSKNIAENLAFYQANVEALVAKDENAHDDKHP